MESPANAFKTRDLAKKNRLILIIIVLLDIFSFVETQTKATAPLAVSSRPTLAKMSGSMNDYKSCDKIIEVEMTSYI
ncbi:MAG TPA: hypothetical protein DCS93_10045 [Microscillaceae bacterium]|nr:hypothetical protein [Microscillaceae bacterium]